MLIIRGTRPKSILHLALAVLLLSGAMVLVGQQQAQAAMCDPPYKIIDGKLDYGWCEDGDTEDPPDDDGGNEPSCDLSLVEGLGREDAQRWCEGENACWANIPALTEDEDDATSPKPDKDAEWIYKQCLGPDGEEVYSDWQWYVPDEPTIEELAWEAYGNLQVPTFSLEFNPPQRTYVTLETWWWAEGPGNGEITGTSAGPVVAIATPDRVEVDPGDGSGVVDCGWVTSKSDDCTYTYKKASVSGGTVTSDGTPAYQARSRLVYDVRFENNGNVIDVPGLPVSIASNWQETPVPVAEIQGIVTE